MKKKGVSLSENLKQLDEAIMRMIVQEVEHYLPLRSHAHQKKMFALIKDYEGQEYEEAKEKLLESMANIEKRMDISKKRRETDPVSDLKIGGSYSYHY